MLTKLQNQLAKQHLQVKQLLLVEEEQQEEELHEVVQLPQQAEEELLPQQVEEQLQQAEVVQQLLLEEVVQQPQQAEVVQQHRPEEVVQQLQLVEGEQLLLAVEEQLLLVVVAQLLQVGVDQLLQVGEEQLQLVVVAQLQLVKNLHRVLHQLRDNQQRVVAKLPLVGGEVPLPLNQVQDEEEVNLLKAGSLLQTQWLYSGVEQHPLVDSSRASSK